MNSTDFNVTIIGGGIIGLAIARFLSKKMSGIVLLEKNESVGQEISSRSSEVIHAGLYYANPSLKLRHCLRGKRLLYKYCRTNKIPFKKTGKLIVANSDSRKQLKELYKNAKNNNVSKISLLKKQQILDLEPELDADEAIFSGTSGIIDSHSLMYSLAQEFENNGGLIMEKTKFLNASINRNNFFVNIENSDQTEFKFRTNHIINACGLDTSITSQNIKGMGQNIIPKTIPYKGNYFYYAGKNPFKHLIYPLPDKYGLGIHVTLDMNNKLKFGPDVDLEDSSYNVNIGKTEIFIKKIRSYWPNLDKEKIVPDYVGLRPKILINNKIFNDFYIDKYIKNNSRLVNCYGVESPGLTSSLSIAKEISDGICNGHNSK